MDRSFFMPHALDVAPHILGLELSVDSPEGIVTIRITEVEAYHGVGVPGVRDEGSHSKNQKTDRNASMFGPPGHAYVYFTYGMHFAINMVCSPEGTASGVLIRSAEVIRGVDLALERRNAKRGAAVARQLTEPELARGPGNLAAALGIQRHHHNGLDLFAAPFSITDGVIPKSIASGPRVGVAGLAGGPLFPWRFWEQGNPTVSAFRPGKNAPRF